MDKKQRRFPQIKPMQMAANIPPPSPSPLKGEGLPARPPVGREQAGARVTPMTASRKRLSFGFETILNNSQDKLKFYWNPNTLKKGVTWVFPAGKETRFGIGSYVGETNLKGKLEEFLSQYKLKINGLHGGYFPHRLGEPTAGPIFLVGDAARQCLPLTGEGIRPALYFGQRCGKIIQKIIDKKITLKEGLTEYRGFVLKHQQDYKTLFRLQKFFTNIPDFLTMLILRYLQREKVFPPLAERYWKVAVLEESKEK